MHLARTSSSTTKTDMFSPHQSSFLPRAFPTSRGSKGERPQSPRRQSIQRMGNAWQTQISAPLAS